LIFSRDLVYEKTLKLTKQNDKKLWKFRGRSFQHNLLFRPFDRLQVHKEISFQVAKVQNEYSRNKECSFMQRLNQTNKQIWSYKCLMANFPMTAKYKSVNKTKNTSLDFKIKAIANYRLWIIVTSMTK
jgi:hypothetical protein